MSLSQFKEIVAIAIEGEINEYRSFLEDQSQADYAQLRAYQGRIQGLKSALEKINFHYRQMFG